MLNLVEVDINRAEAVFDELPIPILLADNHGKYTFANPAACELLGRDLSELLSLSVRDVSLDAIDAEVVWRDFLSMKHATGQYAIRRPDGSATPVEFTAVSDFAPGQHLSVLHDASDRQRIERVLRRDEELFNRVFRISPVPSTIERLANGAFIDLNLAFSEATGYTRADLIGRSPRALPDWKNREEFQRMIERLRTGDTTVRFKMPVTCKDGTVCDFAVALRKFESGGQELVVATYTDVSGLEAL